MKVYVPSVRAEIVILVPDPVVVTPPGVRIRVHVPAVGNPLSKTLPVDTLHVGRVMVPTTGAVGAEDCTIIFTLAEATEIHPAALVTVNV